VTGRRRHARDRHAAELKATAAFGGIGSRDAEVALAMTTQNTDTIDLGRYGFFGMGATPEQAQEIERLGYGTIWVGGSPPAELSFVEPLLESTTTLKVATGIVNIWTAAAKPVAESFHRINSAYPGRFLLGVGVGHPEAHTQYRKPYDALVSYLDELDEYGVPVNQRVLAALGPRVLRLSAERSAGAHPANATPEHAAQARAIIGPNALLAPVHNVVLTADAGEARAIGRAALDFYFNLTNYVSNWKRLGFTDADVTRPGSDEFIDAVIAHGTPDDVAERLSEYLSAGANHVAILVPGGPDNVLPTLSKLAGPLGLSR
jgi:probable F420-dependent oxidoreductase